MSPRQIVVPNFSSFTQAKLYIKSIAQKCGIGKSKPSLIFSRANNREIIKQIFDTENKKTDDDEIAFFSTIPKTSQK